MNPLNYKGYEGSVEFSAEDDCLCGKVLNIRSLLSYEGKDIATLRRDFESCVDDYLESCRARGVKPDEKASAGDTITVLDPQNR